MTEFSRRRLMQGGAAAATIAALPTMRAFAETPVKFGVIEPFSGGLELFGNQAKLGLDLAVAEINAGGGILGRPVELIYEDDKTDPKTAVEKTLSFVRPRRGRRPDRADHVEQPRCDDADAEPGETAAALCHQLRRRRLQPVLVFVQHRAEPGAGKAASGDEGAGRVQLLSVGRRLCLATEDVRGGRGADQGHGRHGRRQGIHAVRRQGFRTRHSPHPGIQCQCAGIRRAGRRCHHLHPPGRRPGSAQDRDRGIPWLRRGPIWAASAPARARTCG